MPQSFLSQSKRSTYVDKLNPEHEGQRTKIQPGKYKYIFIYPFVKTREWYLLPMSERQKMMDEHILVGNKFPSVKLNTTYSFGLDDQDFVVAFESDYPSDFLDLVMALRETQGSRFTRSRHPHLHRRPPHPRGNPKFNCVNTPHPLPAPACGSGWPERPGEGSLRSLNERCFL
jgi:chlorite dismutase